MKKRTFITFFITIHLIFACALIDKQSRLTKLSYEKQTYEQKIKKLNNKKQHLTHMIHALQNHQKIKTYAAQELKMNPLYLKNIKKLPLHENLSQ